MKRKRLPKDNLDIPDFLRVENRPANWKTAHKSTAAAVQAVDPTQAKINALKPPEFGAYIRTSWRRGRFNYNWLDNPETMATFRRMFTEDKEKAERRAEDNRRRLAEAREMRVNPLKGLVPLRDILAGLGDKAPRRKHACAAIDEAKLEHTRYYFQPGEVTLARVRQVLLKYVPPVKVRGAPLEFPPTAVIRFRGENPKREGTDAHARWEKLRQHNGMTVDKYIASGGNPTTLKNAIAMKRAEVAEDGVNSADEQKVSRKDGSRVRGKAKEAAKVGSGKPDRRRHATGRARKRA